LVNTHQGFSIKNFYPKTLTASPTLPKHQLSFLFSFKKLIEKKKPYDAKP
tara:strand:+ start:512 stop:661 length:150 start_codon:yes stop_codon:yes gene_type:complete